MGSKLLIAAFIAIVIGVGAWQYEKLLVRQDFVIHDHISCNPSIDPCFVATCEGSDEECDGTPYKKIYKHVGSATACVPHADSPCPELSCDPLDQSCEIITCSHESLEEGEACTLPEDPVFEDSIPAEDTE